MKAIFMKRLVLLFVLSFPLVLAAQLDPADFEAEFEAEMESLGLDDEEVIAELEAQGFDMDNLGTEDIPAVEAALEEIIADMTAAQALEEGASAAEVTESVDAATESVSDAIDEGIERVEEETSTDVDGSESSSTADEPESVEEVTEEVDKENLPKSNIYGQQLFRDEELEIQTDALNVKPPDSYILGVGDEIAISVFGNSQASFNFEINAQGYIDPPAMSRIYLKGLTLAQARSLLRSRFAQYYSFGAGEFEASVSYARVITVNIVGEVFNPGSYILPATNTIFNALVLSGGPNDIGTLRRIKLLRDGQEPKIFDVYEYLSNPVFERDFFLQENDYIHVGVFDKVVGVEGAVRRPFGYELMPDENLMAVLGFGRWLNG